jgi:hypothetical protein
MLYSSEFPKEVSAWPQVTTGPHRFGGSEFRFQRAEIGHLHSDGTLDIPFPLRVRDWLIAEGIVTPHHFLPKSGWTTFHVDETNAERALWLLRLSYLRYAVKQATKKGQGRTVTRSALSTNWSRSPAQISSLCLTPLPFPHREPAA